MSVKLPKQWRQWCLKAGLRPSWRVDKYSPRGDSRWFYLKGHGRHWRVNCHNELDVSEPYSEFDRWANSTELSVGMPVNEKAFVKMVNYMLEQVERNNV